MLIQGPRANYFPALDCRNREHNGRKAGPRERRGGRFNVLFGFIGARPQDAQVNLPGSTVLNPFIRFAVLWNQTLMLPQLCPT